MNDTVFYLMWSKSGQEKRYDTKLILLNPSLYRIFLKFYVQFFVKDDGVVHRNKQISQIHSLCKYTQPTMHLKMYEWLLNHLL